MFSINLLRICFLGLQITFSAGYTLYNWNEKTCCDGKVFNLTSEGRLQDCCGDKTITVPFYDDAKTTYNTCCNGEIITRDNFDYTLECCNKKLINITEKLCFNNTDPVQISDSNKKDKKTQICGPSSDKIEFYNNRAFECCGGKLVKKELKKECVESDYVSTKDTLFCRESGRYEAYPLNNKNRHKMICCGLKAYNFDEQTCIMNEVVNKNTEIKKHCCGFTYAYNWTKYLFELIESDDKNIVDDEDCEQFYAYDYEYSCRNNVLYQPSKNESFCFWNSKKYNTRTQACCFSQIVDLTEEEITEGKFQCCEEGAPNSVFSKPMLY